MMLLCHLGSCLKEEKKYTQRSKMNMENFKCIVRSGAYRVRNLDTHTSFQFFIHK